MGKGLKKLTVGSLGVFIVINIYFALQIESKVGKTIETTPTVKRNISSVQKTKVAPLLNNTSPPKEEAHEISDQEIINWVIDNKTCMVLRNIDLLKSRIGMGILKHSYSELNHSPNSEESFRDIIDSNLLKGELIGSPQSLQGEFLNALLLGGFLNPSGIVPLRYDYTQALGALENLERKESDNALFTLYKAALLKKMNAKDSDIREAIIQALYKKTLRSPFFDFKRTLYEKGLSNSTFYLLSQVFNREIPSLNLTPVQSSLLEFSKGLKGVDLNLHHELISLGQRFMRSYAQNQQHLHLKSWAESFYNFGTALFLESWKALYPEFNEPFYESDAFRRMAKGPYSIPMAEYEKLLLQPDCNTLELEDRLQLEREFYYNRAAL